MTSYAVYPSSLPGLGFDVVWTPEFLTSVQRSMSGKETAIRFWAYPIRNYTLTYDILGSSASSADFQTLYGFFLNAYARGNIFMFTDPDDYSVSSQSISTAAGGVSSFQLVRTYASFTEPVYAPNTVLDVSVGGTPLSSTAYTVGAYGSTAPGVLLLSSAPSSSLPVTASFTYYQPCRFREDMMDFNKFMYQMWEAKTVSFYTQK